MKRARLTPVKALFLLVAVGILALTGIPALDPPDPPTGELAGVVLGPGQMAVAGAHVALFHGRGLDLVELTETDAAGCFAFSRASFEHHVFVRPADESGLAGAWCLARAPAEGERGLRIQLERGRPIEVEVRDAEGWPVERAEVRAYDVEHGSSVIVRTETDSAGIARLVAPRRAHLAAFDAAPEPLRAAPRSLPFVPHDVSSPDPAGRAAAWRFDAELEAGERIVLWLPAARALPVRLTDPLDQPVEGAIASVWDRRDDWHWSGYARSDARGELQLAVPRSACLLRVVDPTQRFLPVAVAIGAPGEDPGSDPRVVEPLVLRLSEGLPLDLTPGDSLNGPARVWVWSEETGTWGWGARSGSGLAARSSPADSVVVTPLQD